MLWLRPYTWVNRNGSAAIASTGVKKQMAQFIKDCVDDEDQQDGFIFNRFYADTSFNGVGIPWEEIL